MTNLTLIKHKSLNALGLTIGLAATLMFLHHEAAAIQTPVVLGSTSAFGVLAATTVTSTGATTVNGDLGVSPGTTMIGSPTVTGALHLGDSIAAQAQLDLTTAYNDAAGRNVDAVVVAGNLGGQTLTPGLYKSTSSLEVSSGDLTLDAQGDATAVFIFQMASTLTTTAGRQVILSGGAQAANVFWQVGSSATLGTTSVFKGSILALASITVTTGAAVEGRLLARTGAVTLDANTVGIASVAPTITLQSAAVPTGPYTDAAGQVVNPATKTITVPLAGSSQFYRIRAGAALAITSVSIVGGNVVITHN